ncbi:class I SAM-dependent methyltransferase [Roseiconus nitratireducens]|uniref:Class I SAM-dependent methyltransferase n=1 Tax=Roseiconus nitratireducens TaxID=2605748 RepID=A0A5M6DEQ2_9BACT|nr:class I SAM-dependent methyltransferase [Roseiconus nitratireducens]KAA5546024.1 class I SAM-dependent methyltransferase [Roseiconus nitratireducens]
MGNGSTNVIQQGDFQRRIAINLERLADRDCVETLIGDWATMELPVQHADVVTCCQVIEHLTDEQLPAFVDRLFAVGRSVIITVPYQWPAGWCKYHVQDPIDLPKLDRMVGRRPSAVQIVTDGNVRRVVAAY